MRILKFRMFDLGMMKYFDLDDVYYNIVMPSNGVNDTWIMQYTGINDRNGKSIYEGDILMVTNDADEVLSTNSNTGFGIVEWLHDFWNVSVIENSLYGLTRSGYVEVIGNVIENENIIAEEYKKRPLMDGNENRGGNEHGNGTRTTS